ncbi:MAG: TolC family protein [Candidatus Zixiibacteriota bacterium]
MTAMFTMKHIRYLTALMVLSAVLSLPPAARAETVTLDLRAAIQRAMASNEGFKSALEDERRAHEEIKRARAGMFPKIDFDASYTRSFEIPEVRIAGQSIKFGSTHSSVWGLNWEQSIWEGGRVLAAWAAARNVGRLADAASRQAGIEIQALTATVFFDAMLAERLVVVAARSLEVAEANYEVVKQKYDEGLVSEYDHLQAKVRVAILRPPLISAQNQRDIAKSRLCTIIGLEPGTELELVESQPDSSAWESQSLEDLVELAIDQRPDLEAAKYEIEARKNAVSVARADYFPSLRLSGSFNWQTYTDDFGYRKDDITRDWVARVMLSIPIFDGFRRSGNVGVAQVDLSQAQFGRQELVKQTRLEVESARHAFIEATERLMAQEETVAEAQRGLDIANTRYESGVGTQLEVRAAQLELTTAQTNAETARHDRNVARVAWRRAMGEAVLNDIPLVPED